MGGYSDDGYMKVVFGGMEALAADLNNGGRNLLTQLENLNQQAMPLVQTWDGSAKEAYFVRQRGWTKAAEELSVILQAVQRAVVDSHSDYRDTEAKNTAMFPPV